MLQFATEEYAKNSETLYQKSLTTISAFAQGGLRKLAGKAVNSILGYIPHKPSKNRHSKIERLRNLSIRSLIGVLAKNFIGKLGPVASSITGNALFSDESYTLKEAIIDAISIGCGIVTGNAGYALTQQIGKPYAIAISALLHGAVQETLKQILTHHQLIPTMTSLPDLRKIFWKQNQNNSSIPKIQKKWWDNDYQNLCKIRDKYVGLEQKISAFDLELMEMSELAQDELRAITPSGIEECEQRLNQILTSISGGLRAVQHFNDYALEKNGASKRESDFIHSCNEIIAQKVAELGQYAGEILIALNKAKSRFQINITENPNNYLPSQTTPTKAIILTKNNDLINNHLPPFYRKVPTV